MKFPNIFIFTQFSARLKFYQMQKTEKIEPLHFHHNREISLSFSLLPHLPQHKWDILFWFRLSTIPNICHVNAINFHNPQRQQIFLSSMKITLYSVLKVEVLVIIHIRQKSVKFVVSININRLSPSYNMWNIFRTKKNG